MVFQVGQRFFIVAHQHALAGGEVDGGGEFLFRYQLQVVQRGLFLYVHVVGGVGQQGVVVVGEQGETVLDGFLFNIRYHFGVDAPLEQDFAVLGVYDLRTVVGQDETAVFFHVQGIGQRGDAECGSARSQYQADTVLLEAEQSLQVAWRNLFFRVGQGTVQVEDEQLVFLFHFEVSVLLLAVAKIVISPYACFFIGAKK